LFLDWLQHKFRDNISQGISPSTFFGRISGSTILIRVVVVVLIASWVTDFRRAASWVSEFLLTFTISLDLTIFNLLTNSKSRETVTVLNLASQFVFIFKSVTHSQAKRSVFQTRVFLCTDIQILVLLESTLGGVLAFYMSLVLLYSTVYFFQTFRVEFVSWEITVGGRLTEFWVGFTVRGDFSFSIQAPVVVFVDLTKGDWR
jgi:hypothetical protein